MKKILTSIRKKIGDLTDLKEESIKYHIVCNRFLKEMGFDLENLVFEESVDKYRADMSYRENGKPIFLIETKAQLINNKIYRDLSEEDVKQLLTYLNNHHSNIKWGLLTNGSHYILINRDIQGDPLSKIVLNLKIDNPIKEEYWKYFSYENIFETKTTNYLADIAQFKAYKIQEGTYNERSWAPYWSLLFRFFSFYGVNHPYISKSGHPHEPLMKIEIDSFHEYITHAKDNPSNNKTLNSKKTINASYSYISSFFKALKTNGYISRHNFEIGRDNALSIYNDAPKQKSENYLTTDRYKQILNFLWSEKNSHRNIVIFLLCSYYGFDRSDVLNLSWNNIDFEKEKIIYSNRSFEMTPLIKICLEKIFREQNSLKKKSSYVIVRIQNDKAFKPNESLINSVFDSLTKIDIADDSWSFFSPQYVKMKLPIKMFDAGYSIESIVYFFGIDIKLITNYIPLNTINSEGKKRISKSTTKPTHPFKSVVDQVYKEITGLAV